MILSFNLYHAPKSERTFIIEYLDDFNKKTRKEM